MEALYLVLGLVLIYSWVHGAIIVGKKVKGTTSYENVVLIVGLVGFVLYVIGTITN